MSTICTCKLFSSCSITKVNSLLEKALVEEAVLLAETIAAVEASRDPRYAEEVRVHGVFFSKKLAWMFFIVCL